MEVPIPISASPTVPARPLDVPVASEVMQQIINAVGRKILGDRIFRP